LIVISELQDDDDDNDDDDDGDFPPPPPPRRSPRPGRFRSCDKRGSRLETVVDVLRSTSSGSGELLLLMVTESRPPARRLDPQTTPLLADEHAVLQVPDDDPRESSSRCLHVRP